jgi:sugar lactone lactonase YvrE
VAGGPNGNAKVYDADSGAMLASYQLIPAGSGFINDVIVTQDAAYFTNSFAPYLYRIPVGPGGKVDPAATPETIMLTGDWMQEPGFNANGIAATANGKALIVVNSNLGEIYKVNPKTGEAQLIDLGGASQLTRGDGILLQGQTLYVVRNRENLIAVVELAPNLLSGAVTRNITNPAFDVPTTVALFGSSLYAVNARFGTPVTPDTEYQVVKVPRN